jgi:hypothetical protein
MNIPLPVLQSVHPVGQRRPRMAKKSKGGKNIKKPKQDKAKKGPSAR